MTSQRNRAEPSQDGGYALLWQRYDNNKMVAMRYYGNVIFYIFNSTVIDWTCYMFFLFLTYRRNIALKRLQQHAFTNFHEKSVNLLSAYNYNNAGTSERIFIKFDIREFYNVFSWITFDCNQTNITALHIKTSMHFCVHLRRSLVYMDLPFIPREDIRYITWHSYLHKT